MSCRIIVADVLEGLAQLEPESVQCCVTSPPYWGLRDYGTASWQGGDPACTHTVGGQVSDSKAPGAITSGVRPGVDAATCRRCGASRVDRQLGLERTPAEYVDRMTAVFAAVRGVLKPDGTLWLNLGDCYNAYNGGAGPGSGPVDGPSERSAQRPALATGYGLRDRGLKPKDLVGIPWRVALALQAAGWWLRSDIVWSKPNPMPESITDRPTRSHEYLFLLARSARYYYDAAAAREPAIGGVGDFVGGWGAGAEPRTGADPTRNWRTVWDIPTHAYPEAHFATFPPELPERCILAGSRHGDLVLDPFAGAGTTGLVADRLGRNFVGIELNREYAALAVARLEADCPMFTEVAFLTGEDG